MLRDVDEFLKLVALPFSHYCRRSAQVARDPSGLLTGDAGHRPLGTRELLPLPPVRIEGWRRSRRAFPTCVGPLMTLRFLAAQSEASSSRPSP
jgi:hypothetical protein